MIPQCKTQFHIFAVCQPRTRPRVATTGGCRFSSNRSCGRAPQQRCGGFSPKPEPQLSGDVLKEPINNMGMVYRNISVETEPGVALYDITPQIEAVMEDCKVGQGFVNVISRHTTTGITINEFETRLVDDVRMFLRKLAPPGDAYLHNDLHLREAPENWPGGWEAWADQEPENAHSHLCSMMLGNSESIPVLDGKLSIGQWQSVILVELDGPRKRSVGIQVVGGMDL
ncbi:hypothetical protein BSKO_03802 [Bryopsis sp. KO-2023]|nr:hypothetical protein BSKO_03802 [Bryopsis sp. KO-2023]